MADEVSTIAAGFKNRMATITGLNAYSEAPDNLNFPAAFVDGPLPGTVFERVFGVGSNYRFQTHVAVGLANGLAQAQQQIKPYISMTGTQSIIAAILTDVTLGGACQTVLLRGLRENTAAKDINDVQVWMASVEWEVIT